MADQDEDTDATKGFKNMLIKAWEKNLQRLLIEDIPKVIAEHDRQSEKIDELEGEVTELQAKVGEHEAQLQEAEITRKHLKLVWFALAPSLLGFIYALVQIAKVIGS